MDATRSSEISGLTSSQHKVATAGMFSITTRTTMVQPSALVVTITQTGSTSKSFTSPTTSPLSSDIQVTGQFNCAVGDILTVAVTSSAAIDQPPNLIRTQIILRQGV